jgi:hypothetical protein
MRGLMLIQARIQFKLRITFYIAFPAMNIGHVKHTNALRLLLKETAKIEIQSIAKRLLKT